MSEWNICLPYHAPFFPASCKLHLLSGLSTAASNHANVRRINGNIKVTSCETLTRMSRKIKKKIKSAAGKHSKEEPQSGVDVVSSQ